MEANKTKVVAYRTYAVDVKITAPTVGALEDFEKDLRRALKRTVNTRSRMNRHGVAVVPAQTFRPGPYSDISFVCLTSATTPRRR